MATMSNSYYLLSGHDGQSVWMAVKRMAAPSGLGERADSKDEAGKRTSEPRKEYISST